MSISGFAFNSLQSLYEKAPSIAATAAFSAGISFVNNRYNARLTLPAPEAIAKFTAVAYTTYLIFNQFLIEKSYAEQIRPIYHDRVPDSFDRQVAQGSRSSDTLQYSSSATAFRSEMPRVGAGSSLSRRERSTRSYAQIASELTTGLVGAAFLNAKFNPESTLLSFVKLSVTAALSFFAVETIKSFGDE